MASKKVVEIRGEVIIPFKWEDDTPGGRNLGRAEFAICIKTLKRGVVEFWVTPEQQHGVDTIWHWKGERDAFLINSYEGLADSKVWHVSHCKEHGCTSIRVYVPNDAKYLRIAHDGIGFCKTDWGKP